MIYFLNGSISKSLNALKHYATFLNDIIILKGEIMSVELRPWTDQDYEELVHICNHIDRTYLSDTIPNPYHLEDAKEYIALANQSEGQTGIYRAILNDGKIVGNISVVKKKDIRKKDSELGYYLGKEFCSRGIMTEAVRQILLLSFKQLDIIRISAYTFAENIASQRVLEKNGFIKEGIARNSFFKNNQIHDEFLFSILKEGVK